MAGTWDVPAMLGRMPAPLFLGWMRYYAEEPWDACAQAVLAFGKKRGGASGDDPDALEAEFARFAGGA